MNENFSAWSQLLMYPAAGHINKVAFFRLGVVMCNQNVLFSVSLASSANTSPGSLLISAVFPALGPQQKPNKIVFA